MSSDILYSGGDHSRVESFFDAQMFWLHLAGQVRFRLEEHFPAKFHSMGLFLSRAYYALMTFQSVHLSLLAIRTTLDSIPNGKLEDITQPMTLIVIYTFAGFAMCYILWWSPELVRFLDEFNRPYRHHSLPGLTYVSTYSAYVKMRRIVHWWVSLCVVGATIWALTPIIIGVNTLPLDFNYPFNTTRPYVYEVMSVLQLLGQMHMAILFGNGGGLLMAITIFLLAQYDVLYCSLKNLEYYARLLAAEGLSELRILQKQLPASDRDECNQYILLKEQLTNLSSVAAHFKRKTQIEDSGHSGGRPALQQALHHGLVECVKHHKFLLECFASMERFFNPYCLVKSLQISILMCLLLFSSVEGKATPNRVLNFVQYLLFTSTELFIFTYCGELLRDHSGRVVEAFGRSQWWHYAHPMRKDVLIFLINAKRAVTMTAGKLFVMDLNRLRLVITQAFSFLTLLQRLAENKRA